MDSDWIKKTKEEQEKRYQQAKEAEILAQRKDHLADMHKAILTSCGMEEAPVAQEPEPEPEAEPEHTGKSVSYYDVVITRWTNPKHQHEKPVTIACNDIIEALNMNYACANAFKAIWRICAAKQGKLKKGNNAVYDAEKAVFFAERVLTQEQITSQQTTPVANLVASKLTL